MKQLLLFITIIFLASFLTAGHTPSPPHVSADTSKPRYQYFIRTEIPVQVYQRINYVSDSIIEAYRNEMGDRAVRMYYEHVGYMRQRTVADSVLIKGGK